MVSVFSNEVQEEMKNQIVDTVIKTLSVLIKENGAKRYMRLSEASKYASVSQNTLMMWVEKYHLPISSIEGVRIIDSHDLNAMIAKFKI